MKQRKILLISIIILGLLVLFYMLYPSNHRDGKLMGEGNSIVKKIEDYRKINNSLPVSLTDIGIKVKDEANPPIYYEKRDNSHFTVSFGTSLGESKIYYSDSKRWENFYREMK